MQKADLKVLIVASEVAPYVKSGGLGDVAGSLPKALKKLGIDVRVVLPKYKIIKEEHLKDVSFVGSFPVSLGWREQSASILFKDAEVPTYFIENEYYFHRDGIYGHGDDNERFAFFSKAVTDMLPHIDFYPDIIHTNDWQTAPVCIFLRETYKKLLLYKDIKSVFTIHNLQYQGTFAIEYSDVLEIPNEKLGAVEYFGNLSYMKTGLEYADVISTVSDTYAKEIQTSQYGYGLDGVLRSKSDKIVGIINGIDYETNNPETDNRIYKKFSISNIDVKKENKKHLQQLLKLEERDVPIISIISRLADQKGMDLIMESINHIMEQDVQFVVLGTGEMRYEAFVLEMAKKYPNKFSANVMFDEVIAQKIYAGSDIFLMPSLFEPCGLGQMFALRYGTIPLVRKTGGLADTIVHFDAETKTGNGFVFEDHDANGLIWAFDYALEIWNKGEETWNVLVKNALSCNFSWNDSAVKYKDMYVKLKEKSGN